MFFKRSIFTLFLWDSFLAYIVGKGNTADTRDNRKIVCERCLPLRSLALVLELTRIDGLGVGSDHLDV